MAFSLRKVDTARCSGQDNGEQHWQFGVQMATILDMSFDQEQGEQQEKRNAQSHTHTWLFILLCSLLFLLYVVFALCACRN